MHSDSLLADDQRLSRIEGVGINVLRYGVVFLLVVIGAAKFFAFEAEAIKPFVAESPFMSWTLDVFGVRGTSSLIGCVEILTGIAMASRRFSPLVSGIGSAVGALIFVTTLSFLFTTPGAFSLKHPASGFLMKDIVLLGACIVTGAEALRARLATAPRRRETATLDCVQRNAATSSNYAG